MAKRSKTHASLPEWAKRIESLRRRLKISQGTLARSLRCSAMTISRWERGLLAPSANHYVELGKISGKADCWFFWERAGLQVADVVRVLPERAIQKLPAPHLDYVGAGIQRREAEQEKIVAIPLRKAVAGSHGQVGDKRLSLDRIPATKVMGAPTEWCPNPGYTSLLRVRGHSMEPLLHDGDIMAVDSFQTDMHELDGKVVVVANEEKGLCVSRFRRYLGMDILESENREYEPVILGKDIGWRILGRVLWWVHAAP